MENVYLIMFLIGVIYSIVSFLLGEVLGVLHFGNHLNLHMDGHLHFHGIGNIFLALKPITVVSFITVFGGIGVIGTHYKLNPTMLFILALVVSSVLACSIYKFIIVPLYKAQNTSAVYQKSLIGSKAEVIAPIIKSGFGTIAYVVNGSKHNAPAKCINEEEVKQGEEVIIYKIEGNIFYVEPLN